MNRFFRRATILAGLGAAALGATAASATAFTFTFTGQNQTAGAYQALGPDKAATGLDLKVYGGHLTNTAVGTASSGLTAATVEEFQGAGLGVLFDKDKGSDGTHQIDNFGGGSDFVALVFDQDVTLSSILRSSYTNSSSAAGLGKDTDISFLAYNGTTTALTDANTKLSLNSFSSLSSGSNDTNSKATSKIWLVAANVTGQTDDAFKLRSLTVNTPTAAVPEPASWAMMLIGFGAVGSALRRRRPAGLAAA